MDRNNDGIVGLGERRTFWHTRRAKVTIVVNKYDLDADGWISGSESEAWMKDRLRIINTAGLARVDTDIEREFDVNGDGVIDRREAHALRVALGERAIVDKQWEKIADRNKDGKVDAHEAKVFWRKHKSKVDTPIEKKYDADGNGWLSGSEAKKMLGDLATLIKTNGKAKVNTPLEKQFDANADGIIDSAEAQAILDAIDERSVVDTRWESLADKNNDGKVDAKEANIFWKRHKAKVNTPLKKKYDINGDGILTENELKGLLQAQMAMIKTGGKAKVNTGVEKQFDVDDDGVIDFEEAQALQEALKVAAAEKS
jgi:Ca2+-binding EF-hand superfamily protein